jgi:hypothetical protein
MENTKAFSSHLSCELNMPLAQQSAARWLRTAGNPLSLVVYRPVKPLPAHTRRRCHLVAMLQWRPAWLPELCVRRVDTEPLLLCTVVGKYPPQLEHVKNANPARQSTYAPHAVVVFPGSSCRLLSFHREARGQHRVDDWTLPQQPTMPANISTWTILLGRIAQSY